MLLFCPVIGLEAHVYDWWFSCSLAVSTSSHWCWGCSWLTVKAAPLSAHLPCCFALVTASTVGQGGNSGFLTTLELWEALKMLTQALLILWLFLPQCAKGLPCVLPLTLSSSPQWRTQISCPWDVDFLTMLSASFPFILNGNPHSLTTLEGFFSFCSGLEETPLRFRLPLSQTTLNEVVFSLLWKTKHLWFGLIQCGSWYRMHRTIKS